MAPTKVKPSKTLRRLGIAVLLLLSIVLGTVWLTTSANRAPEVAVKTLDGRTLTLSQLRGRPVLVTFWATTCASCVAEIPHLVDLHDRYNPRGLEIIAVAMAYDPPNRVVELTEMARLPYTVALDLDGAAARAFDHVRLTPTTFLVSPQGEIVHRRLGELNMTRIEDTLERML